MNAYPQKLIPHVSGQIGTVVETLAPDVFEVEFSDNNGRAFAEVAVNADKLLVLHYEPMIA